MNLYASSIVGIFLPLLILALLEEMGSRINSNILLVFTSIGYVITIALLYRYSPFYIFKLLKKKKIKQEFDSEGNLILEIPYYNNLVDGKVREFYFSGILKRKTSYLNGIKDGKESFFDENGNLLSQVKFEEDESVSGFYFNDKNEKIKMTNAHLYKINKKEEKNREQLLMNLLMYRKV